MAIARAHRHADLVISSGLFDPAWYAAQAGCAADPVPAARHYLLNGARTTHSPHPLFDPGLVTEQHKSIGRRNPLLAYVSEARYRRKTTHRLFDQKYYVAEHPDAADHRVGPVAYYVEIGVAAGHRPNSWFVPGPDEPGGLTDWVRARHDEAIARADGDGPLGSAVDWDRLDPTGDPAVVSVIITTDADPVTTVRAVERVHDARPAHPDGPTVEVIVVDNGCRTNDAIVLDSLTRRFPDTIVHHGPDRGFAEATRLALGLARGSVVVFLSDTTEVGKGWLDPLLTALEDPDVHGAQSLLVRPSGSIRSAGIAFPADGGAPHALLRGFPIEDARGIEDVTLHAASAAALAMRRSDVVALRGFDPVFGNGLADAVADADLGLRSGARRPGRFTVRTDSVVIHRESRTPEPPGDWQALLDRHGRSTPGDDVRLWAGQGFDVVGHHGSEPVLARRPLVEVIEGTPRLRWALKNPAPYGPNVELWGDTHFARRLGLALERLGQQVVIDNRGEFARDSGRFDDVALVLRGLVPYEPAHGQVSIAWLISHPELLTRPEAQAYDRVFAASEVWAERMSREWGIRIDPLLQATDPELFHPDRGIPDTGHRALFVGMGRKGGRPMVRDAIEAGLPLAIYGHGWEEWVPAGVVRASNLPNREVGEAYRRAGVVLNDHWEDMRVGGFVSNRLFDAAASGARVITDDVQGLGGLFGRSVQVAHDVAELKRLTTAAELDAIFGDDAERRAVARRVHAEHSFEARARTLLDAALELRRGSTG